MKILLPQNIFSGLFALALPDEIQQKITICPSSEITKKYLESDYDIALIPSLDLLKNDHLFVSAKNAISFDGAIANSYFYFSENNNVDFSEMNLQGDVSINELILTKILFKENYDQDIKLIVDTSLENDKNKNLLIIGNKNFVNENIDGQGVSFPELFIDSLNYPYVNFIFVSEYENAMKQFHEITENINSKILDGLTVNLNKFGLTQETIDFISLNSDSFYFDFTENEELGLSEILRLPFFYGIYKEINEIKYIK